MTRLIHGVGINDVDYVVQVKETVGYVDGKRKQVMLWMCPYYQAWCNMLERCYSVKYQERSPTYKGCSVVEDWRIFSTFKEWMLTQDWEGKSLDKDLLFPGNKIYGPETCVFVDQATNNFLIDRGNARGVWPIGVCWHRRVKKFMASCSNPFTGNQEHLGYFNCPDTAHLTWRTRKHELACLLAEQQTDSHVAEALRTRYLQKDEVMKPCNYQKVNLKPFVPGESNDD